MSVSFMPSALKFEILKHSTDVQNTDIYNKTYHLWQSIWEKTYKELGSNTCVSADHYYLFNDLYVVLVDSLPVVMIATRQLDLRLNSSHETSYIQYYGQQFISELSNRNIRKILSLEGLAVHPDWRKSSSGFSFTDLIVNLALMGFKESSADAVVCYTRNNRGINSLFSRFGGKAIVQAHKVHNVEVDMMYLTREMLTPNPNKDIVSYSDILWKSWQLNNPNKPVANNYNKAS